MRLIGLHIVFTRPRFLPGNRVNAYGCTNNQKQESYDSLKIRTFIVYVSKGRTKAASKQAEVIKYSPREDGKVLILIVTSGQLMVCAQAARTIPGNSLRLQTG